jgi:hypothetical protein
VTETRVDDLPPLALERARMVIASTIASEAMGAAIVSSRIICELAREHTEDVLSDWLGLSAQAVAVLKAEGAL